MKMASEQTSIECDQLLNKYGYNKIMADRRIDHNTKISELMTMMTHRVLGHAQVDKVLVGSRREGISLFGESDTDVMFILNDVLVREKSKPIKAIKKHEMQMAEPNDIMIDATKNTQDAVPTGSKIVFVMDINETPPGYTLLQQATKTIDNELFTNKCMVRKQNRTLLSSHYFLTENKHKFRLYEGWAKSSVQYAEQKGPSLPETISSNDTYLKILDALIGQPHVSIEKDCVIALPCHCPSLLYDWQNRNRSRHWLTAEMIHEVIELPVHVVPVGLKGSRNERLQWRISFTFAEIYLVQNLNETQIKILILLRSIAKERLKPISNNISSYVIKNILFWLSAESPDLEAFSSENLLERAKDGLLRLRNCIRRKQLPCYMLPQRNLLRRLNKTEVKQLVTTLDDVIQNDIAVCNVTLNVIMKKNEIEKLAELDRVCLELNRDMTTQEIFAIAQDCSKCTNSCWLHIYYAYRIIKSYCQKKRITQLLNCVSPNDSHKSQLHVEMSTNNNEKRSINNSQEQTPLTCLRFEETEQIGLWGLFKYFLYLKTLFRDVETITDPRFSHNCNASCSGAELKIFIIILILALVRFFYGLVNQC